MVMRINIIIMTNPIITVLIIIIRITKKIITAIILV